MSQPSDSNNTHPIPGFQTILVQWSPHRRSTTHQRPRIRRVDRLWDLHQRRHIPRDGRAETSLVEPTAAELRGVLAAGGCAEEAWLAVAANGLDVSLDSGCAG